MSNEVIVFGAGRVGLPIIGRLVRAGHSVRAVDSRPEVAAAVRSVGASWAGTTFARVPSRCTVLTILPGSPELREVMLGGSGQPGLLDRIDAGATWIDMTSAAPDLGRQLALYAAERGVDYLDAALGGGAQAAERGLLSLYVGGNDRVLAQSRPLLTTLAEDHRIHHMGAHGAGYLTKLLVNLLWFSQAVTLGETLLLAKSAGLHLPQVADVLEASAASSALISDYLPGLLGGDYAAHFGLDRCLEELESLQRYAESSLAPFRLSGQVVDTYRDALAHFGAIDGELLAIAFLEHTAGMHLG